MDLARLERLDAYSWSLRSELGQERLPVILFGSQALLESMDEKVREQVSNVARLPGLVGSALTMPDAHWGYGFPIGGVAAFDPERGGIISAGGVGFDISCGIRCLRSNLAWTDVAPHAEKLADALFRAIPAGVGEEGELRLSPPELDELLMSGAVWAVEHGFGTKSDLEHVEERGCMGAPSLTLSRIWPRGGSAERWTHWGPATITWSSRWSSGSSTRLLLLRLASTKSSC